MPEAVAVTVSTDIGPVIVPDLNSFPPTGTPKYDKPASWDFYRSMGSPKRVVAPMVDQSELAWRVLSRRYGADLVYTPMINAKLFVDENTKKKTSKYQEANFNKSAGEEGALVLESLLDDQAPGSSTDTDRPLLVQFCANDPDILLKAAHIVQDRCSGVDLNLGCPQHIARRGHYGSYLMEDWPLIFSMINNLHINCKVPVTAKMRVYESVEKSVAYAKMLERAGAQIITVHGRTREMKGHKTGLADWIKIKAVKEAVSVPVFTNGNVLYPQDWKDALQRTATDGVMSAEGNLYNPAIFLDPLPSEPSKMFPRAPELPFPSLTQMAHEYLDIVAKLKTPTNGSAIKAHFFRLCRPGLEVHRDLREVLGKSRFDDKAQGEARILDFRAFVNELERRLSLDIADAKWQQQPDPPLPGSVSYLTPADADNPDPRRPAYIPHWLLQPYFRPPLVANDNTQEGGPNEEAKKARADRVAETKAGKSLDPNAAVPVHDIQTRAEAATLLNASRPRSESAEAEVRAGAEKKQRLDETVTAC